MRIRATCTKYITPIIDSSASIRIGVFARPPVAGQVKTRLIPDLGAQTATAVYRHCLRHALDITVESKLTRYLFLSEPGDDPMFAGWETIQQQGEDLGRRMARAMEFMLEDARGAIIIGSDCLDLHADYLRAAATALDDHDLVLQPADDGGYVLIGCTRIEPQLFAGVDWGTPRVLEQTLRNAERIGYRVRLLETLRDIDRLQDLNHYPELRELITHS